MRVFLMLFGVRLWSDACYCCVLVVKRSLPLLLDVVRAVCVVPVRCVCLLCVGCLFVIAVVCGVAVCWCLLCVLCVGVCCCVVLCVG